MSDHNFDNVIAEIAKKNRTSPDKIREEMQHAMDMAMQSSDPAVQARWALVPRKGDTPTLEEFVCYLVSLNLF